MRLCWYVSQFYRVLPVSVLVCLFVWFWTGIVLFSVVGCFDHNCRNMPTPWQSCSGTAPQPYASILVLDWRCSVSVPSDALSISGAVERCPCPDRVAVALAPLTLVRIPLQAACQVTAFARDSRGDGHAYAWQLLGTSHGSTLRPLAVEVLSQSSSLFISCPYLEQCHVLMADL